MLKRESMEALAGTMGGYGLMVGIVVFIGGGNPWVSGISLFVGLIGALIMGALKIPAAWARATRPRRRIVSDEDSPR